MFDALVVQWGTLLGFAALIAVLINILKLAGVVTKSVSDSLNRIHLGSG